MQDFAGKVAVVTGAASGIGRAIAMRAAGEGMKVVLADVDAQALATLEAALVKDGVQVRSIVTDVSKADQVDALARLALDSFGGVHLLCNIAGVMHVAPILETTKLDWEWVLGVNLWGVVHGVRSFLPAMIAQAGEAHIVNMSSTAGFNTGAGLAAYKVSKHGVVAFSEVLYYELAETNPHVGVSVLCPSWVNTPIMDADRNRPSGMRDAPHPANAKTEWHKERGRQSAKAGASPESIADSTFEAVRQRQFYISPHADFKERFKKRADDILAARNPSAGAPARNASNV